MQTKKPPLIIPDWADWVLALFAAVGVWRFIDTSILPTTNVLVTLVTLVVKLVIVIVTYFLVWVIVRTLAEPSRLYVQGLKILNQSVNPNLAILREQLSNLQRLQAGDQRAIRSDIDILSKALAITNENVIHVLLEQSGITLFNGMVDIRSKVDALAKLVPGHVRLLKNPELVADFDSKVAENRRGLQGYLEFIEDEARRVSSGEIFSMTTGARMLSALVNVLPLGGTKQS